MNKQSICEALERAIHYAYVCEKDYSPHAQEDVAILRTLKERIERGEERTDAESTQFPHTTHLLIDWSGREGEAG